MGKIPLIALRRKYSRSRIAMLVDGKPLQVLRDIMRRCSSPLGRATSEGLLSQVEYVWPGLPDHMILEKRNKRISVKISVRPKQNAYNTKPTTGDTNESNH